MKATAQGQKHPSLLIQSLAMIDMLQKCSKIFAKELRSPLAELLADGFVKEDFVPRTKRKKTDVILMICLRHNT